MKIVLGSDHGGYELKEQIKTYIEAKGHDLMDVGCYSDERVDYPLFGKAAAQVIANDEADRGIIICGSGIGISIAANRNKKVRCALVYSAELTKLSRLHNNANMIALGGRFTDFETAKGIVDTFLETEFEGERHIQRVEMLG